MAKSITTIMLAKDRVAEMREIKARAERWAGRTLSWGDFVGILLTVYEARGQVAEMHQDVPMSEGELAEAGWAEMPLTLSEADQERIAELVVEKLIERLIGVLEPNTNPSNQTVTR